MSDTTTVDPFMHRTAGEPPMAMTRRSTRPVRVFTALAITAALLTTPAAQAHQTDAALSAAASALSALPVAVSVAAPAVLISGGVVLTVASVQASVQATEWVLVRASDGARMVLRFSGHAAGLASVAVGTAVTVTALSAGHVLSVAGEVVAFIPNELGKALLYNERLPD